jgi:hypothetical protein
MKTYGGVEIQLYHFSPEHGHVSYPCRFTLGKTVSSTYCIGGCVGPRIIDVSEKRKI